MTNKIATNLYPLLKRAGFGFCFFALFTMGTGVVGVIESDYYFTDAFFGIYMLLMTPGAWMLGKVGIRGEHFSFFLIINGILGALIFIMLGFVWKIVVGPAGPVAAKRKRQLSAIGAVCTLAVFLIPLALRRNSVPLPAQDGKVAVARISFVALGDLKIYAGKDRVFNLWNGIIEHPLMVHPLDEAQRFLCVFDNDTEDLVFVVDTSGSSANTSKSLLWVPGTVRNTKALVRLPRRDELQMTIDWLRKMNVKDFEMASIPFRDYGFYRTYADKESIMTDLNKATCERDMVVK